MCLKRGRQRRVKVFKYKKVKEETTEEMSIIRGYVVSADKGLRVAKGAIDLHREGTAEAVEKNNCDYEGNFEFSDVEPGSYWLEFGAPFFDPIRVPKKGFIELEDAEEKEYEIRAVYTAL